MEIGLVQNVRITTLHGETIAIAVMHRKLQEAAEVVVIAAVATAEAVVAVEDTNAETIEVATAEAVATDVVAVTEEDTNAETIEVATVCLLYTSPSPRDA